MKLNPTLRFLGSIKLAVPLLSAIALILIGATFYESHAGSTAVQQTIYKSPWFGMLMSFLAVNLGVSAVSRYPWRGARKIGFALTHFGLIVIIAGSAAVIHLGMEGMLLLRTDGPSNSQIRVEGNVLETIDPQGNAHRGRIAVREDGSVSPSSLGDLEILGYSDRAVKSISFVEDATVNNPAVRLRLHSSRMGQTLEQWLAIAPQDYDRATVGLAELELLAVEDEAELQSLLSPPSDSSHRFGVLEINAGGQLHSVDVEDQLSKTVAVGEMTVKIVNFWSDFRLDRNNQPISTTSAFNNPAVQLEVATPTGVERWFVFGKEALDPVRTVISGERDAEIAIAYAIQSPRPQNAFRILVTPAAKLFYTATSRNGFKSGSLAVGETVTPGWTDFEIELETYLPHAQLQRTVIPAENPNGSGTPALFVQAPDGVRSGLLWGEPTAIAGDYFAAFSPQFFQLPFAVKLEDFIVERNEGSESVAMWTSQIEIRDRQQGVTEERKVWMNHPTWYRGWKIAQASWNPGDLRQSTLQVKREPLWVTALTWSGSALVVLGIATMFYGPAIAKQFRTKKAQAIESESVLVPQKEEARSRI